jgi:two-component system cell cycle response regulator DivK
VNRPVILVVEDDEKSRRLMHDVLEHEGYDVVVAVDGEEGLDLIRSLHPALVLMDIQLPGMSGLDAVREIRAEAAIAATTVVAVTAAQSSTLDDDFQAAGFDGFQPKPLVLKQFLGTVRRLLPA